MSYTYRNKKSGEVITTSNKVTGKNWEPIEDTQQPPMDDTFEDDTLMGDINEEDIPEEDIPEAAAGKTKTTRRGKK